MTPDHIKTALHIATKTDYSRDPLMGQEILDTDMFAKLIQFRVLDEVLAICRANCVLSDSALELYKDLQAYDRFERGFNF